MGSEYDAPWNLELLGEHEGGTSFTLDTVKRRLAEQETTARDSGIGRGSFDEPEIVYELLRRFHGCGYATEAAAAVIDADFATGPQRIGSTVRSSNVPSFRVLEKIGFQRDHSMFDDRGELIYLVRNA